MGRFNKTWLEVYIESQTCKQNYVYDGYFNIMTCKCIDF